MNKILSLFRYLFNFRRPHVVFYTDSVAEGDSITVGNLTATFFRLPPFSFIYSKNDRGYIDGIEMGPPTDAKGMEELEEIEDTINPFPTLTAGNLIEAVNHLLLQEDPLDGYRKADYAEELENHKRRCSVKGCGHCNPHGA